MRPGSSGTGIISILAPGVAPPAGKHSTFYVLPTEKLLKKIKVKFTLEAKISSRAFIQEY
jgi:hypothetical protein